LIQFFEQVKILNAVKLIEGWVTVQEKKKKKQDTPSSSLNTSGAQSTASSEEASASSKKKASKQAMSAVVEKREEKPQPAAVAEPAATKLEVAQVAPASVEVVHKINLQNGKIDIDSIVNSVIKANKAAQSLTAKAAAPAAETVIIGSKASPAAISVAEIAEEPEDDWIPASNKAKKNQKAKLAKAEAAPAELPKQTADVELAKLAASTKTTPVVMSTDDNNNNVEPAKASKKKKKKPSEEAIAAIQQAQQQQAAAAAPAPVENKPPTAPTNNAGAQKTAIKTTANPKVNLKQTNLTDSMILVDKQITSNGNNNQSSSESLQDAEGDDGNNLFYKGNFILKHNVNYFILF
jgi:hypothetical protein